jgi:hypothetical protein
MPVSYGEKKAIEWLEEQNTARASLALARTAGTRVTIALVISGIALVATVLLGLLK